MKTAPTQEISRLNVQLLLAEGVFSVVARLKQPHHDQEPLEALVRVSISVTTIEVRLVGTQRSQKPPRAGSPNGAVKN